MDDEARRIVLARRAGFVAAALAGLSGCHSAEAQPPAAPGTPSVTVETPKASSDTQAAPEDDSALPPREPPPDADGDGVADVDDRCPEVADTSDREDTDGCPEAPPMPCLSLAP